MIKILKASAGSGKTYNLAKEYIKLLLASESPDAYRHILAVTFTNKATDEMKRRILKELSILAAAPENSPYISDLVPGVMSTNREVKLKAERMMTAILHDYGSFAVSTIDKFFQQTLRAFSREIGQFTSYQVELDKSTLVDDAVDSVLNGLNQNNRPLLEWIIRGVKADLHTTGRFAFDKRLKDLAMNIVSENTAKIQSARDELTALDENCQSIIKGFTNGAKTTAFTLLRAFESCGVDPKDTNRGFAKSIYDYTEATERELILPPTPSFMEKARDSSKWFAKTKANLMTASEATLTVPMQAFCDFFEQNYKTYSTAFTIKGQIYGLGLAGELKKAFVAAQKEHGVISIEDTNTILHEIIDGTDTPFLYEKLGVRFENFLLDEFQDTSNIQWDNFLPLLRNSDADGNENLVVGDVKQSIYRWRGSQWDLLDSRLQKQFRVPEDKITVLDGNYRTCRAVVNFNNVFFPFAASEADRLVGNAPASPQSVRSIYGDVVQEIRTKDTSDGSVSIRFVENADAELDEVVATITNAKSRNARYSDIAVLVRGNAEGAQVASRLVNEHIPVISDDSLYVKSSVTVRRLISQLALVDNPSRGNEASVEGYLAREYQINIPKCYHCLSDLSEGILSELETTSPELFANEAPFIQAFMDWLQDWSNKNGNNLGAMLRDWEEAEPKIASPESTDAVRIMTIHKAKGLEFPLVILPFAEKIGLYKPSAYWCSPKVEGTPLSRIATGQFRANLSDASMNSLFSEDYVRERSQQAIDNINVLYVAMTRAKCELKVIATRPTKAVLDAVAAEKDIPAKNFSHLLYGFTKSEDYLTGTPYDYGNLKRETDDSKQITLQYICSGENIRRRLCFRTSTKEAEQEERVSAETVSKQGQEQVLEPTLF